MSRTRPALRHLSLGVAALAAAGVLAACGGGSDSGDDATTLRLGYFANITHATALIGIKEGIFAEKLAGTPIEENIFNAGGAASEAMLGGSVDITFIGPNPSINAFATSNGEAVRIISGATSGGAQFVVTPSITGPADLKGAILNTPQLGNTQDVALRYWLKENGLSAPVTGEGDVTVEPQDNANTLQIFTDGGSQGAWLPEPWSSRLVLEAGGKVLVDEADLWPEGKFVTTQILVRTAFLEEHPDIVKKFLEGVIAADQWIADNPDKAPTEANAQIEALTDKAIPDDVLKRAWSNIEITLDPLAKTLEGSAEHATEVGVSKAVDLNGIYDLSILNELLKAAGEPTVSAGGLGKE